MPRTYRVISGDGHIETPPEGWVKHVPAKYRDRAPRLIRLENGESSQVTNLIRVVRALGLLDNLDAFIPPPLPSPIEQLRSRAKERRRASPSKKNDPPATKWTWGDEASSAGGEA